MDANKMPRMPEAVAKAFRTLTRDDSTPEESEARMLLMRHIFTFAGQPAQVGGVTELMVQWARDYLLESGVKVSEYDVRCAIENALRATALPHPQPDSDCETCGGRGYYVRYYDPYNRGDVSSPEDVVCPDCTPHPPSDAPNCTCPSGDGSLRWPCPKHPPIAKRYKVEPPPSDAAQGEASLTDLYWHITRNALKDGSPFAMECMKGLRALNDAATSQPAQVGVSRLVIAGIGRKHFGNPIPSEWYAAVDDLLAAPSAREGGEAVAWQRRSSADGYVSKWGDWNPDEWPTDPFPASSGRWVHEYRPLFLHPAQPAGQNGDHSSTHHVHRGPESLPCYCAATSDHPIGQEQPASQQGEGVRGLVEKWRADAHASGSEWDEGYNTGRNCCADELAVALDQEKNDGR